jgi:hypothetical protein
MKKINQTILTIALVLCWTVVSAQFKGGFKFGAGTYDVLQDSVILRQNNNPVYTLHLVEARIGYFAGLVAQINMKGFILQPEFLYNYSRINMRLANYGLPDQSNAIEESLQSLCVPLMIGTKAGPLRLNLGPIATYHVLSSSDLLDIPGFSHELRHINWGFQAGLGIDFWKILFDLRYEGNINRFNNHLRFYDVQHAFNDRAKRLVASVSFVF